RHPFSHVVGDGRQVLARRERRIAIDLAADPERQHRHRRGAGSRRRRRDGRTRAWRTTCRQQHRHSQQHPSTPPPGVAPTLADPPESMRSLTSRRAVARRPRMTTVRRDDHPGGVRVLTLDRPPANALDETLMTDLGAALDEAGSDDAVRALVLTGAGAFFSAGFDLAASRRDDAAARALRQLYRDTHVKLLAFP